MRSLIINICYGIIFLSGFSKCSQKTNSEQLNTFKNTYSSKIDQKDSLYIIYTLKTWTKSNFDVYHDYSKEIKGINSNNTRYKILRVFYSPDRLKLFCWIVRIIPNNLDCHRPQGYSCSSSDIIGFRKLVNEKWKLYPLELELASCFDNENQVLNQLGQYYFRQMKNHSEEVNKIFLDNKYGGKVRYDLENEMIKTGYGDKNSPFILKDYGYNLQDKQFWTKSLIWQKGARIPGLYNFQTLGSVRPDEKKVELIPPKVTYPDSILQLYQ